MGEMGKKIKLCSQLSLEDLGLPLHSGQGGAFDKTAGTATWQARPVRQIR